jgi:hypothetical protein
LDGAAYLGTTSLIITIHQSHKGGDMAKAKKAKKAAASVKSEKREYKTEAGAKAQQKQWEKKGYKVTRRKNALYLKK